jgi:hypothetical protein
VREIETNDQKVQAIVLLALKVTVVIKRAFERASFYRIARLHDWAQFIRI